MFSHICFKMVRKHMYVLHIHIHWQGTLPCPLKTAAAAAAVVTMLICAHAHTRILSTISYQYNNNKIKTVFFLFLYVHLLLVTVVIMLLTYCTYIHISHQPTDQYIASRMCNQQHTKYIIHVVFFCLLSCFFLSFIALLLLLLRIKVY